MALIDIYTKLMGVHKGEARSVDVESIYGLGESGWGVFYAIVTVCCVSHAEPCRSFVARRHAATVKAFRF